MDAHTLALLEFDKVRELLAGHAASSLGKELARALEPMTDPDAIRADLSLVTEMTEALGEGQAPPSADCTTCACWPGGQQSGRCSPPSNSSKSPTRWPAPAPCIAIDSISARASSA